jgi:hypothetical protein
MFLCWFLDKLSEKVEKWKKTIIVHNNFSGIFAYYVDDINIYAHHSIANAIASELDELFFEFGMKLAKHKCRFYF